MISPLSLGALVSFGLTLGLELVPIRLGQRSGVQRGPQAPSLAIGLVTTMLVMAAVGTEFYGHSADRGFWPLMLAAIGGMVLFSAGFFSDRGHTSSGRNLIGTLIAAVLVYWGGTSIVNIGLPGIGLVGVGPIPSLMLTLLWVFLVVSAVEIFSLLPLAAGTVALMVGSTAMMPFFAVYETYAGDALCGALLGSIPARTLGELIRVRSHALEKTEVLVLGHTVACATLAIFLKSVAGAIVLPLSLVAVIVVVLATHSFDRSLILRAKPKE